MGEKKKKSEKRGRVGGVRTDIGGARMTAARAPADRSKSVRRFRTGNGPGFTVDGQIVSMKIAMAQPR